MSKLSLVTLGPIVLARLLASCGDGDVPAEQNTVQDAGVAADAEETHRDEGGEPADAGSQPDGSLRCRGYGGVTVMLRATPGSLGYIYFVKHAPDQFPPGVTSISGPLAPMAKSVHLAVIPDIVEATTTDGRVVPCTVGAPSQSFSCHDDLGLSMVHIHVADAQLDVVPCPERLSWEDTESVLEAVYINASTCIPADSVVVEGSLRGYEPTADLAVWLVGEKVPDPDITLTGPYPLRPCSVAGHHYTCTTLGYPMSSRHRVVVEQAKTRSVKEVVLEVDQCRITPVTLDFDRP